MAATDQNERLEYRALAQKTATLCSFFNYAPSAAQLHACERAMVACEALDRIVDASDDREPLIASVRQEILRSSASQDPLLVAARNLAEAFGPYASRERLVKLLERLDAETLKQCTKNRAAFHRAVKEEGRLFTQIFAPIFHDAPKRFLRFLELSGAPGNLIDKFLDAERDFIVGDLLLTPSYRHRACLFADFLVTGARSLYPAKSRRRLIWWATTLFVFQRSARK